MPAAARARSSGATPSSGSGRTRSPCSTASSASTRARAEPLSARDIEAAPCRLYLLSPPEFDPAAFAERLTAVLDAADVACFQLDLAAAPDDAWLAAAGVLAPVCQGRGVAFLLNGHAHLVAPTGADGIHVQGPVKGLRGKLPRDAILGAGCGLSRHDAMVAGEQGADYVSFGPWGPEAADLLGWWQETMEPPCIAAGGITAGNAADAARAGADFLLLRSAVWDAKDPPATLARILASLD